MVNCFMITALFGNMVHILTQLFPIFSAKIGPTFPLLLEIFKDFRAFMRFLNSMKNQLKYGTK